MRWTSRRCLRLFRPTALFLPADREALKILVTPDETANPGPTHASNPFPHYFLTANDRVDI